jgi:hypothetical protein
MIDEKYSKLIGKVRIESAKDLMVLNVRRILVEFPEVGVVVGAIDFV